MSRASVRPGSDTRAPRGAAPVQPTAGGARQVWTAYAVMGVLLAAYLGSLIVRSPDQSSDLVDGWLAATFELVGAALCIGRAAIRRPGRAVAVTLGLALLMWSLGDFALTIESRGGAVPSTPSVADAFYLLFYPLAYVALVLFMRGEVRKLATPSWLDGAVAGMGTAAVCAAFAFASVVHLTGDGPLGTATNLAYPIADLLLLALVGGGSTLMAGRRKAPWVLMATGIAINTVGDTANLFQSSFGSSHLGHVCDGIAWPTSILVLSMSVWIRPRPVNPLVDQKPGTFVVPGVSAAAALAIVFVGNFGSMSRVALGLATATLLLVGLRLALSLRGIRALSLERRDQSVTDELTGLGNRRRLYGVLDAFFADYDAAESPRPLAFLFVDLDRFKEVNDTFGHPAGDKLLKQLGPRLSACLRESDLLIRLGGDEFVVVLVDGDTDYANEVAQRLSDGLAEPFVLDTVRAQITASIGIAHAPTDATDGATLMWCADVAMYRAKLSGVPFAELPAETSTSGNRLLLLAELRTAIEEHPRPPPLPATARPAQR